MALLHLIQKYWDFYTTPQSSLPDDARKEYITRAVFYFATVLNAPIALTTAIIYTSTHLIPVNVPTVSILAAVFLFIGWRLIQRGYWRIVRYLLIGFTYLVATYVSLSYGFSVPGMLFFVAALLFAAMITPPKVLWSVSLLSAATAIAIAWLQRINIVSFGDPIAISFTANIIVVILLFGGIGALLHFLTRQFENALIRAEATAQELKAYQTHLEQLVAERTAQLEKEIAERRESERTLAKAQHIAQLGSWEWDIASGEVQWSEETKLIFQLAGDDNGAEIESFLNFVHPDDRQQIETAFTAAVNAHQPTFTFDHRVILPNGETRMIHGEGELIYDDRQNLSRVFGIVQDITRQWEADEALKASLAEKDTLLREIHHRVKNNLQIIRSLLYLQARQTDNAIAQDALEDSYQRVQSMALVHETLYQSTNLAAINFGDYARSLTNNLKQSFTGSGWSPEIKLDIATIPLEIDTAVPCGLILNELVSNALKYAFPKQPAGASITLQLFTGDDGKRHLVVHDNGVGIPEESVAELTGKIRLRKKHEHQSLGVSLIRQLTTQLKGTLHVDTTHGTRIELIF